MIKELLYKIFRLEELPCRSCETLRAQLEISNYEKKELLKTILDFNKPKVEEVKQFQEIQPIRPKNVPWTVRRQMIEAEDRVKAQKEKEKREEIEELEKELGIDEKENVP